MKNLNKKLKEQYDKLNPQPEQLDNKLISHHEHQHIINNDNPDANCNHHNDDNNNQIVYDETDAASDSSDLNNNHFA